MKKICKVSKKTFEIKQKDQRFYNMMWVSEPSLCPNERQRRRLVWQNMYHLYHRECDATGKKIISNFSPDKEYIIYEQPYWWWDNWDFRDTGKDFDFNRPFFEQWWELLKATPLPSLFTEYTKDVNSAFTNFAGYDKNCYLIFHADMNEDCYYATWLKKSKKCVDSLNVFDSELTYECVNCKNCYDLKYSQDCNNCTESWFLRNCFGCKNCFGCMNLINAEYHLFNKKVTPEEYKKFIWEFESGKHSIIKMVKEKYSDFSEKQIHRVFQWLRNENCSGDHIFDCKDVTESFDVQESRDMKFCQRIYNGPNSDCYDVDQFGLRIRKVYESANIWVDCERVIASLYAYNLINVAYSAFSFNCEDCFGCVWVKRWKYCILNKEYSKEEYFKLKTKIIEHMKKTGEWGEFFPASLTPFSYNETVAQEYYPLTEAESKTLWYKWKADEPKAKYTGWTYEIPDDIKDVENTILENILECEWCEKHYRIVWPELEFYKNKKLPIPRKCSNCRHIDRINSRTSRELHSRRCDKCDISIETSYAPERVETIYCETCYDNKLNK